MATDTVRKIKIIFESDVDKHVQGAKQVEDSLVNLGTIQGNIHQKLVSYTVDGVKQWKIVQTAIVNTTKDLENFRKEAKDALGAGIEAGYIRSAKVVEAVSESTTKTLKRNAKERADIEKNTIKEVQSIYTSWLNEVKNITDGRLLAQREYANTAKGIEQKLADDIVKIQKQAQDKINNYIKQYQEEQKTAGQVFSAIGRTQTSSTTKIARLTTAADAAKQALDIAEAEQKIWKRNSEQFTQLQNNRVEQTNRVLELERLSLQRNGGQRAVLLQQQANHEIDIRRNYANTIAAIERQVASGMSATVAAQQAAVALQQMESALRSSRAALETHLAGVNNNSRGTQNLGIRVLEMIGLYRLWSSLINTVVAGLKSIPEAGIEMQSTISALHASFSIVPGTSTTNPNAEKQTTETMRMLQAEANRTGISILTLEKNYRTFLASAHMAGESTATVNKIFKDLNTTITALHMSGDRAELTFLALAQMFNKGKIQSEELVKQLGNLLPGAFARFAAANGKNTEELVAQMKAGAVKAHETVQKFIEFYAKDYADAFALAAVGLNANLGRLDTAWTNFARSMFILTQDLMTSFVKLGATIVENLTPKEATLTKWKFYFDQLKTIMPGADTTIGTMRSPEEQLKNKMSMSGQYESVLDSITQKTAELNKYQKELNDSSPLELLGINLNKVRTDRISLLKEELRTLATEFTGLGIQITAVNNDMEVAGKNFEEEISGNLTKIKEYTYASEIAYAKIYNQLQAQRDAQKKQSNADAEGFVAQGDIGLTKADYNIAMEKAYAGLHKAELKAKVAEEKDYNKLIQEERSKQKETLQNSLEASQQIITIEKEKWEQRNKDLDALFKSGNMSLQQYYKEKELLGTISTEKQVTEIDKQIALVQQQIEKEKELSKNATKTLGSALVTDEMKAGVNSNLAQYAEFIKESAKANKVSEAILFAMMGQESGGNLAATSKKNAMGLMQLLKGTFKEVMGTQSDDFYDPKQNIEAGARYFAKKLEAYKGQNEQFLKALAAYNAGEGNVDKAIAKAQKTNSDWKNFLPDETKGYITQIPQRMEKLGVSQDSIRYVAQYTEANAESSKEVQKLQGEEQKLLAQRDKLIVQASELTSGVKNWTLAEIQRIQAQYASPQQKYEEEIRQLKDLREGVDGVTLSEEAYNAAKLKALDNRDKAIETIKKETEANQEAAAIIKKLNNDIYKTSKDDETTFLTEAYNRIMEKNDQLPARQKASTEAIKQQMDQIKAKYKELQDAMRQADWINYWKTSFISAIKEVAAGTKTIGEALKSTMDGAIGKILDNSLTDLAKGFSNLIQGVSVSWTDMGMSAAAAGISLLYSWATAHKKIVDTSKTVQENTGVGTVLGDTKAKSESITKSIELLAKNSSLDLPISNAMLASLKKIESGITGLAAYGAQQGFFSGKRITSGISTGDLGSDLNTGFGIGSTVASAGIAATLGFGVGSLAGLGTATALGMGLAGGAMSLGVGLAVSLIMDALGLKFFGRDKQITDYGITSNIPKTPAEKDTLVSSARGVDFIDRGQSVADIKKNGIMLANYVDTLVTETFAIFFSSDRAHREGTENKVTGEMKQSFTNIVTQGAEAIIQAGTALEPGLKSITDSVLGFTFRLGDISFKGKDGADRSAEEIQKDITAAFSKNFDSMAKLAVAGLEPFQQVGEGYYQTMVRVASGVEQAQAAANALMIVQVANYKEITNTQGDVAVEILRQSILNLEKKGDGSFTGLGKIIQNLQGTIADEVEAYKSLIQVRKDLLAIGDKKVEVSSELIQGAGGLQPLQAGLSDYRGKILDPYAQFVSLANESQETWRKIGIAVPQSRQELQYLIETITDPKLKGAILAQVPALLQLEEAKGQADSARDSMKGLGFDVAEVDRTIANLTNRFTSFDEALASVSDTVDAFITKKDAAQIASEAQQSALDAMPELKKYGVTAGMSPNAVTSILQGLGFSGIQDYYNRLLADKNVTKDDPRIRYLAATGQYGVATKTTAQDILDQQNKAQTDAINTATKNSETFSKLMIDISQELATLGKSDVARGLANINNQLEDLVNKAAAAGQTISNLADISKAKTLEFLKPTIKEFANLGKSDIQIALEEAQLWRKEWLDAASDIAAKIGIPLKDVQDAINAIGDQKATNAIKSAKDALKSFQEGIADYVKTLERTKVGTPQQQFEKLQSDAIQIYQAAMRGDTKAMAKLQGIASEYVTGIETRYGSSQVARELTQQVIDALKAAPEQLTLQEVVQGTADAQLEATKALPQQIADAIVTHPAVAGGTAIIPAISTSSSSAGSAIVTNLETALAEMKKELIAIKENQVKQVDAIIGSDTALNTKLITVVSGSSDKSAKTIAYANRTNVELV